jgi:WD40 repeat protein
MRDNLLVSGSRDATLRVWDLDTGACRHTLRGHTDSVRCLELSGRFAVSGSYDYSVRVWDYVNGVVRGRWVVGCEAGDATKVSPALGGQALRKLDGHTNKVYAVVFDGPRIVSSSMDETIRVWDFDTGRPLHVLRGAPGPPHPPWSAFAARGAYVDGQGTSRWWG